MNTKMNRKEFLKMCGILGVGFPLQPILSSCNDAATPSNFDGKVIIVGAGAAGLASAYLLNQQGVEFEILEASSVYGGRMKRTTAFANFPIPLGAEWLHTTPNVLDEIVNDSAIQVGIETTRYDSNTDYGLVDGERWTPEEIGFTVDRKFINATWFDFFEQYIVPSVEDKIIYNAPVQSIDYFTDQIIIQTTSRTYTADKVIMTAPLKILQSGMITFNPALPRDKREAIQSVEVWDGCKAFIEFSEKFYPTFIGINVRPATSGQKLYYDASYGQNTNQHILGLFSVGDPATMLNSMSDQGRIDFMLNELDDMFDGKASANYVKHIFQNWNEEPFARGAYLLDHSNWRRVRTLGNSVAGKIFFAGTAYTDGEDWGSVHSAALSGKRAVNALMG